MSDKILTSAEFLVPISQAALERGIRDKTIPQPFKLSDGARTRFWRESQIEAWLDQRASA